MPPPLLHAVTVYVDGSGGEDSAYGYYVLETGESYYKKRAWSSKHTSRVCGHTGSFGEV